MSMENIVAAEIRKYFLNDRDMFQRTQHEELQISKIKAVWTRNLLMVECIITCRIE